MVIIVTQNKAINIILAKYALFFFLYAENGNDLSIIENVVFIIFVFSQTDFI